jgi:hypothetical protein
MKLMVALTLLALALSGCSEKSVVVSELPEDTPAVADAPTSNLKNLDPGDVEANVAVELTLDPASSLQSVAEELRNAKKKLNSLTLTSAVQLPGQLWIKIHLKTTESFAARPAVLRGTLYREVTPGNKEAISSFQTVLDEFAAPARRQADRDYFPMEFRADILQGLATLPTTMLVSAEVDVLMAPLGTDATTLDPVTYTTDPDSMGVLLSNPVRVNFDALPTAAPGNVPATENASVAVPTPEAASVAETPGAPDPSGVVAPGAEVAPDTPNGTTDAAVSPEAAS